MTKLIRSNRTSSFLVPLAVGALLIASCGDSDDDSAPTAAAATDGTAADSAADAATGDGALADATEPAQGDVESGDENSTSDGSTERSGDDVGDGVGDDVMVTVEAANGEITVPITTSGIVALDEWAAQMLLALGVVPDSTANYFFDAASLAVAEDAGVGVIESGNIEVLAAETPTMIIGTGQPAHLEVAGVMQEIAPVVLPDLEEASWEEQLRVLAAVTGTDERAEQIIGRVAERSEALATQVRDSDLAGSSLSIVVDFGPDGGGFFALEPPVLAAALAEDFGLLRPPDQTNDDPSDFGYIEIADELVPSQGADIIISLVGDFTAGLSALDNELLPDAQIEADVDSTTWAVSTPLSAWWILDDYESILFGDRTTHTVDDALAVWAGLTAG